MEEDDLLLEGIQLRTQSYGLEESLLLVDREETDVPRALIEAPSSVAEDDGGSSVLLSVSQPPIYDFVIPGLSPASSFALELFLSRVHCVPFSEIHVLPSSPVFKGSNLEVKQGNWNGSLVAVKRLQSSKTRDEHRKALGDTLLEIRFTSHKPLATHRNIVALRAVAFDDGIVGDDTSNDQSGIASLQPVLIVDWAYHDLQLYLTYSEVAFSARAELVSDIADGLQVLHLYGIIHADLKPANVLLFPDPEAPCGFVAKLADFGVSGSEEHKLDRRGETSRWRAPLSEAYTIERSECPADVFSFGLLAMFVALEREWDPAIHGQSELEERRTNLEDSLRRVYGSSASYRDWSRVLESTVTSDPRYRLTTQGLSQVRIILLGRDKFEKERRDMFVKVNPFRGTKGLHDFATPALEMSKMAFDMLPLSRELWNALPDGITKSVLEDLKAADLSWTKLIYRPKSLVTDRTMAALGFLATLVPAEEITSRLRRRQVLVVLLAFQVKRAGERIGIEDVDDRPFIWQLAAKNQTEEVMQELKSHPNWLYHRHRGHSLITYAAVYGKVELLSALLDFEPSLIDSQSSQGFTALFYAGITSGKRGTECLRILLEKGGDVYHIALRGESLLSYLFWGWVQSGEWLPISKARTRILEWAVNGFDAAAESFRPKSEDAFPQPDVEMGQATAYDEKRAFSLEVWERFSNHLGSQHSDTILERIEIIREVTNPSQDMITVPSIIAMYIALLTTLFHTFTGIFCVVVVAILLTGAVIQGFHQGKWNGLLIMLCAYEYVVECRNIMIVFWKGTERWFETRVFSMTAILVIDFLVRASDVLMLAPIALYFTVRRVYKWYQQFLRELRWMQKALDVPVDVDEQISRTMARVLEALWKTEAGETFLKHLRIELYFLLWVFGMPLRIWTRLRRR